MSISLHLAAEKTQYIMFNNRQSTTTNRLLLII